MKIEFEYILKDHGWAIGKLKSRNYLTEFHASHLHDSMRSMINSLIGLLTDRTRVVIPFYDEPGERQLIIEKIDSSKIVLELKWYEDYATEYLIEADKYESLYKGETTLKSFITNSYDSIKRILDENGIDDYKKLTELKNNFTNH